MEAQQDGYMRPTNGGLGFSQQMEDWALAYEQLELQREESQKEEDKGGKEKRIAKVIVGKRQKELKELGIY